MFVPFIQSIYSIFCSFFHWFVYLFVCLFICIHTLCFFYFLLIYFVMFICSLIRLIVFFSFICPFLCSLILLTDTFINFCLLVYLVICSFFNLFDSLSSIVHSLLKFMFVLLYVHSFIQTVENYLKCVPICLKWSDAAVHCRGFVVTASLDYNEFCFVSQK